MSYARFGCSDSDVYVYQDINGLAFVCHSCDLASRECRTRYRCERRSEMINHLLQHKHKGDSIPNHTIERLFLEITKVGDFGENEYDPYKLTMEA